MAKKKDNLFMILIGLGVLYLIYQESVKMILFK